MKPELLPRSSALLAIICLLSGCVATDVGNPQTESDEEAEAEIRIQGYAEMPGALTLSDGIEITHAWLSLGEFWLEVCDEEEGEEGPDEEETPNEVDEMRIAGPVVTDLLSGTSFPGPVRTNQSMTRFCAFSARLQPLPEASLPAGVPRDIAGDSIVVRGLRKDGTPFIARAALTESIELEGEIELQREGINRLLLAFALEGWLTHSQVSELAGNPIRIDAASTPEIYDEFVESVLTSARLYADDRTLLAIAE